MNYLYNGVELPALPNGLNTFNYLLLNDNLYELVSATAEEKTISSNGAMRITSSEGIAYIVSDGEWVEFTADNYIGIVVWADTDVYNSDGTLYLAASEPVPIVPTPPSAQTAFFIGKAFGRLIRNAMKPVAIPQTASYCLYNGVKLPNIDTVWTEELKQTYPCAAIITGDFGVTYAVCILMSSTPVYESDDNRIYWGDSGTVHTFDPTGLSGTVFEEWTQIGTGNSIILEVPSYVLWSNTDILNSTDNTIYLAASDPIPVYE